MILGRMCCKNRDAEKEGLEEGFIKGKYTLPSNESFLLQYLER
jgi:hypothetical protein